LNTYRIRGNRTLAFYSFLREFQGGALFEFCPNTLKNVIFGKKMALYSKWHTNPEWRSITSDMVGMTILYGRFGFIKLLLP